MFFRPIEKFFADLWEYISFQQKVRRAKRKAKKNDPDSYPLW